MCHATLQDPKLLSFLLLIDQDLAAQAQAAACACGGVMRSARYPRKPRDAPRELLDQYRSRLSFCCAACRRRTTPESVRYLGRRVYLAAVVVLSSVMRVGITGKRVAQLSGLFAVPLRPGGHPKSPSDGHFKIPHLSAAMMAEEFGAGLHQLGILHQTTLPYSPYQNAKQESFWSRVEGRLMAMLEGADELSLELLNTATGAWVEHEYQRSVHSEIGGSPL